MPFTRKDLEARYALFQEFALEDQRRYYKNTVKRYRTAAGQVNRWRALMALGTGIAAALASLVVSSSPQCSIPEPAADCAFTTSLTSLLAIASIVLPAVAALFGTLADLYQWDRMVTIYDEAVQNIEIADAQSPDDGIPDEITYRAALMAYAEGTLSVMHDESAQWGQAIRTPAQIEKFLKEAQERAERLNKQKSESGDDNEPPAAG